jgi:hypothetical protein
MRRILNHTVAGRSTDIKIPLRVETNRRTRMISCTETFGSGGDYHEYEHEEQ